METQYCRHCKYELEREPVEELFCSEECAYGYKKGVVAVGSTGIRQVSVPITVALPTLQDTVNMAKRSRKWS